MMENRDSRHGYLAMAGFGEADLAVFAAREAEGQISCPLSPDAFYGDEELQEVLKLLKLDAERFFELVVFLYDYTTDVCFHGVEIEEGGYEMMWMLIERGRKLLGGQQPEPLKTDASCSFKIQGRTYKVTDTDSIAILLYWIHRGMIHMSDEHPIWELNWLINDYCSHEVSRNVSVSVAIWLFASLLQQFFKRNPQFAGRAPRGSGISLNKLLLASRLIYRVGLSSNENFLYSDETLKGFMRQYKGRPLPSNGRVYGR